MQYSPTLDTFLEKEEFVSAEEYLRRRERGEINPADVRYALPSLGGVDLGGFMIKLKQPRYRVDFLNTSLFGEYGER